LAYGLWGSSAEDVLYVGRAAGNTSHGGAGRSCQDHGLAKLNHAVLAASGQAIFYVQSQDCSGVSVFSKNYSLFPILGFQFGWDDKAFSRGVPGKLFDDFRP
jgi:hypothetical protein